MDAPSIREMFNIYSRLGSTSPKDQIRLARAGLRPGYFEKAPQESLCTGHIRPLFENDVTGILVKVLNFTSGQLRRRERSR